MTVPYSPGITVSLLYHPLKRRSCLMGALRSLETSTNMPLIVEVIVQGSVKETLPQKNGFDFDLRYIKNKKNLGVSAPLVNAVARCKTEYWAKMDDDFLLTPFTWDHMVQAAKWATARGFKVGSVFAGTEQNQPHLLVLDTPGVVDRTQGYTFRSKKQGRGGWVAAHYVANGATIYMREVFEAGCMWDPAYFISGEHLDLVWQMYSKGFTGIAMRPSLAVHNDQECTRPEYGLLRMNPDNFINSYLHFKDKWGLSDAKLRQTIEAMKPQFNDF